MILDSGLTRAVLEVDSLISRREIVTKDLGQLLSSVPYYAGATLDSDGSLIPILQVSRLLQRITRRDTPKEAKTAPPIPQPAAAPPLGERTQPTPPPVPPPSFKPRPIALQPSGPPAIKKAEFPKTPKKKPSILSQDQIFKLENLGSPPGNSLVESEPAPPPTPSPTPPAAESPLPEPPAPEPPALTEKIDPAPQPPGPPRILLADDSPSVRKVQSRQLAKLGYTVETASDGKEALDRLQAEHFDLLITDLEMPKLDGFSLIRSVREVQALRDLPIIVLTSHDLKRVSAQTLEIGATGCLVKPFSGSQFNRLLEAADVLRPLRIDEPPQA